jgi:hypothetical protein
MKPTRNRAAAMPLHPGDHAALPIPPSGMIAVAGVGAANMVGRAANGTREQVRDAILQDALAVPGAMRQVNSFANR